MSVSSWVFSYFNFAMIAVHNIYHSQNVSSNRDETLTVTCSHSAETVEFRYGFKLLRLALRFNIFFMPVSSEQLETVFILWRQSFVPIEIINNTREGIVMFIQAKKGNASNGGQKIQMLK